jgi:hypothetical protein
MILQLTTRRRKAKFYSEICKLINAPLAPDCVFRDKVSSVARRDSPNVDTELGD